MTEIKSKIYNEFITSCHKYYQHLFDVLYECRDREVLPDHQDLVKSDGLFKEMDTYMHILRTCYDVEYSVLIDECKRIHDVELSNAINIYDGVVEE